MNRQPTRMALVAAGVFLSIHLHASAVQNPVDSGKTEDPKGRKAPTSHATPATGVTTSGAHSRHGVTPSVIREPSQGRPIFLTPGDTFYFVMNLPADFTGDVGFALQHALEPDLRYPLRPKTPPSYLNDEYCSLVLEVRANTPPGLYDLMVKTKTVTHSSRRSVKVVEKFKDQFRFIHLSNMNVGDLTAPEFDEMLPKEINLLAPEFIVATGDYTEWARALDDASSWTRILKYFEKFNAPVFMLCGLHDHEASFAEFVASDPIGTIDYGNYHGLLLLDHAGNPIDQDYSQIQWVDADLKRNRQRRMNFIVSSSDELGLIDVWRERGAIQKFMNDHKVRMYIAGGSSDWDYKEFADKLKGLDGFHFIRTHESSTCMRDRATGFSHYRVIEVDGEKLAYTYPADNAAEKLQHSIPTGRLRAYFDAPNDGTAGRIAVTVQNALNQPFHDAHVWLRLAKQGDNAKPAIAPGRLVRMLDAGKYWACDVAFDLPDKGAVRIVASMNPADLAPAPPIKVALEGSRNWAFTSKTTDFGLSYFASRAPAKLTLTNESESPQSYWPVIRLNGAQIHPDRAAVPRLPLQLKPGQTVSLPLTLNLRRVSPGPHELQVYFLEDPLSRMQTFDVNLSHQEAVSKVQDGSSLNQDE
jgi:predicted MPP superfamily phosphohydrolase